LANILFLGGPADSLPSIARAKSLGFGCYVIDGNPEAPALRWAWQHGLDGAVADIYSPDDILAEVFRNDWQVDGVMAIGCDIGPIVSEVACRLGCFFIPQEITRLSWDKVALKEVLRAGGIPVPSTADFVVKPQDGRGSRGVSIVSASNVAQDAYREAYLASRTGRVMFEQYIPGPGISAEAIIYQKEIIFCGLTDRLYRPDNLVVEYGGNGPSEWKGKDQGWWCHNVVDLAAGRLGIDTGSIKFDIILDENNNYRPIILEVATGRIGGGYNPQYLSMAYNVDMVAMLISTYTGQKPEITPFRASWGASGRHVAGRYRSNGNLTKNADRGRFHLAISKTREGAEQKAAFWMNKP
jgi:hypothetical protein